MSGNEVPCVNTLLMDRHTNMMDQRDAAFEYVYKYMHALFSKDLEGTINREDIESDILFETGCFIKENSVHDADANEVTERLLQDYDL